MTATHRPPADTVDQADTADEIRSHRMPSFEVMHPNHFAYRHIGPRKEDVVEMVKLLGYGSLDELIDAVVPEDIRLRRPLDLPPGRGEREVLQALRGMADQNRIFRTHIGMGYYGTFVPQVIQRNILENPGWYSFWISTKNFCLKK